MKKGTFTGVESFARRRANTCLGGGTEGKVSQRHRVPVRKRAVCAGLLAALLFVCAVCGAGSMLPAGLKDALPDAVRETVTPVTAQAAGGDPAMIMGTSSVLGQTGDYNSSKANTQVVWYNEKSWYVIGYNRSGVASAADSMTLFATGILKDNVQFNPDSNLIN